MSKSAPKTRVPQAVRTAKMQRRLAEAAFNIIRDGGYVNFRTSAVAKAAGVSQGAQLHHYPTKDDLAVAALEYAYDKAVERFEHNYASIDEYDDLLELILKDFKDFYFSDSFMVALDILMAGGKDQQLRETLLQMTRNNRQRVERLWLERLIDAGWALTPAEDALALSHSIVRGFATRALVDNDEATFERLLQRWRQMVNELRPK
ncbi:MAG: TetR/AcrR family transcriptional regulator [Gammaproteobacteria bacterium]|nr:TetR/AcrR family transcriptional regulator [Gammaproteobacteria bacterium]